MPVLLFLIMEQEIRVLFSPGFSSKFFFTINIYFFQGKYIALLLVEISHNFKLKKTPVL